MLLLNKACAVFNCPGSALLLASAPKGEAMGVRGAAQGESLLPTAHRIPLNSSHGKLQVGWAEVCLQKECSRGREQGQNRPRGPEHSVVSQRPLHGLWVPHTSSLAACDSLNPTSDGLPTSLLSLRPHKGPTTSITLGVRSTPRALIRPTAQGQEACVRGPGL